jgi:hypothetical protein
VLPKTGTRLQLAFELASGGGRDRTIRIEHEDRLLGTTSIATPKTLAVEVGDLPRGRPVVLTLVTEGPVPDCPLARDTGGDARQMGVMLNAVTLRANGSKAKIHKAALSDTASPRAATMEAGCIGAETSPDPVALSSAMPMSRIITLPDALRARVVELGAGWWEPEEFGGWMGAASAELRMILPADVRQLSLSLILAQFGSELVEVSISHEGRTLATKFAGIDRPLEVDVSSLPRDELVALTLSLPEDVPLGCPATRGTGTDSRALGIMLQGLKLSSSTAPPFTSSVAHGGGRYRGEAITNSFAALKANLARFDVFEIDFNWTADGELVCLHDWQDSFVSRFGVKTDHPLNHENFQQLLSATPDRPRNCDLESLAGWLRKNPGVRIVTDVKERGVEAHVMIADRHPDLLRRFVPQASQPGEIDRYRSLGFERVIWTLYRYGDNAEAVIREAKSYAPSANHHACLNGRRRVA